MTTRLASLRWIVYLVLALQFGAASAAETSKEMRAALQQLVASQKLEQNVPAMLDTARAKGIEQIKLGAAQGIAANAALSEPDRARARKIMDELAPQLAASVDAEFRKLDFHALLTGMVESVYPKYFTAGEVRQLAAFYASPAYQKTTSIARMVEQESARTRQDPAQLWQRYGAQMTEQEKREIAAFQASPVGRKQREVGSRVIREGSDYLQRSVAPAFEAAAAAHRAAFMEKMGKTQAR